jgi:hypothetical protein
MMKSKKALKKMDKDQLEAYGRTIGIELDRREVKTSLINQLIEQQDSAQSEEHTHTDGTVHSHEGAEPDHHHHDDGTVHTHEGGDVEHTHEETEDLKIKDVVEAVAAVVEKVKPSSEVLLRNASTGAFYKGPQPVGKSRSGSTGGVPFWEV